MWVAGEADSPAGGEPRISCENHGKRGVDKLPKGGITAIGAQLWLAGMHTAATSNELALIERR